MTQPAPAPLMMRPRVRRPRFATLVVLILSVLCFFASLVFLISDPVANDSCAWISTLKPEFRHGYDATSCGVYAGPQARLTEMQVVAAHDHGVGIALACLLLAMLPLLSRNMRDIMHPTARIFAQLRVVDIAIPPDAALPAVRFLGTTSILLLAVAGTVLVTAFVPTPHNVVGIIAFFVLCLFAGRAVGIVFFACALRKFPEGNWYQPGAEKKRFVARLIISLAAGSGVISLYSDFNNGIGIGLLQYLIPGAAIVAFYSYMNFQSAMEMQEPYHLVKYVWRGPSWGPGGITGKASWAAVFRGNPNQPPTVANAPATAKYEQRVNLAQGWDWSQKFTGGDPNLPPERPPETTSDTHGSSRKMTDDDLEAMKPAGFAPPTRPVPASPRTRDEATRATTGLHGSARKGSDETLEAMKPSPSLRPVRPSGSDTAEGEPA